MSGSLSVPPRGPLISKFASSAAHVAGRGLTSAETGTWLGEHFTVTLDQLKQAVDQLFVSGVNHVIYQDRKSTRLNSSHSQISYAVFCLKKKKNKTLTLVHLSNIGFNIEEFDLVPNQTALNYRMVLLGSVGRKPDRTWYRLILETTKIVA